MEIISARYVLPLTNKSEPIENGAIAIELGEIKAVGNRDELKDVYPGAMETDHPERILMPGLVNAHCYLALTSFYETNRAIITDQPETGDYIDWLISTIKFRKSSATANIIASTQKGAAQVIDAGTTCIGDSTTFEGTYKILDEMGLRSIIYNQIYSGKMDTAQELFENALALVEKYFNPSKDARITAGFYPTAPYLLSKNLLKIISQHAINSSVPIKIHASESFAEMEFFFDSKGPIGEKLFPAIGWTGELPPSHLKTPIDYLDGIGFLKASPAIIGGMHLSNKCIPHLSKNMCSIMHCPTNNNFFGHGSFPLKKLRENGIPIGLGTGAPHRPQPFSMWEEMREVLRSTSDSPTPKEIMQMATIGSAKTLGLENQIGTLEAGKRADYIIVDLPPGHEIDKSYIYGALIRNTHHFNVRKTVVDGEVLKNI